MRLTIQLPDRILVDSQVTKVIAEAASGSFCLLPRHIDHVALLVPGILSYEKMDPATEEFVAVDEGLLVKCGSEVRISTRNAVLSKDLGSLRKTVEEEFLKLDDQERKTRSIITKLETDFVRNILGLRQ